MSMHILGPYMTTTKYNSKNKSTKNKRLLEARERHEKWLEENGYNKKRKPCLKHLVYRLVKALLNLKLQNYLVD